MNSLHAGPSGRGAAAGSSTSISEMRSKVFGGSEALRASFAPSNTREAWLGATSREGAAASAGGVAAATAGGI
jgi:hypothetical protein